MGFPVVLGLTGTWLLKDGSGNKLGLCCVWVENAASLPAEFHMLRASNSLEDIKWSAEPTTAYGTFGGANKVARKNSFQDIWDTFVDDESFNTSNCVDYEWAHDQKIRAIPSFTL
jgi:hypothetical protein